MRMAKKIRRKKVIPGGGLAMVLLRWARGWWDQATLAGKAGFHPSQVSMWERGNRKVPEAALEKTADVTGFPRYLLKPALRVLRSFRLAALGKDRPARMLAQVSIAELFPLADQVLDLLLEPLAAERRRQERAAQPVAADREWAGPLLERLKRHTEKQRRLVVERVPEFRQWALAELLVKESLRLAPNHPAESLEWAKLAVLVAERVDGTREWRYRIEGHALTALTNAWRVCNDLPAARETRARARRLWEAGEPGDPGLLNPAVLPWIEAALYRDERELPQALQQIEEALALDDGELRGKILLTKSNIHNVLDQTEASTRAVLEAMPYLDFEREPRLAWAVLQNLSGDLLHLGRVEEAREKLPEVRRLAERLGGELDGARVSWLEAKITHELGDLESARAGFEQVRSAFLEPLLSYDFALVSVDLSLVLLKQGETKRVRTIAEEMVVIFQSQQVHQEALAALQIFCEAAKRETVTVELAQQVARFLHRAQSNPELKFEAMR